MLGPRRPPWAVGLVAPQPPSSRIERPRGRLLLLEIAEVVDLMIVADLGLPLAIGLVPAHPDERRGQLGRRAPGDGRLGRLRCYFGLIIRSYNAVCSLYFRQRSMAMHIYGTQWNPHGLKGCLLSS